MPKVKTSMLGASAVVLALSAITATAQTAQPNEFPALNPPVTMNGAMGDIINSIGDARLTAIARWYGWSKEQLLSEWLRGVNSGESQIRLDTDGRVFVVDRGLFDSQRAAKQDRFSSTLNAFALESNPGASKTIYLNFKNATLEGSRWNGGRPLALRGYSLDSRAADGATGEDDLSYQEIGNIMGIWRKVADVFAPFDVNVTTKEPLQDELVRSNADDEIYGTTVHVYSERNYDHCACESVRAYVKSFHDVDEALKPVLINAFWLNNGDVDMVSGAVSYALGHAMGLRRDTELVDPDNPHLEYKLMSTESWAPIMGDYFNSKPRQFRKSEDLQQTPNQDESEDEIGVLLRNGLSFRDDDHGGDRFRATPIETFSLAGGFRQLSGNQTGIIERNLDADVFAVNAGAGELTVQGNPASTANLELTLHSSDGGQPLARSNPLDSAQAGFSHTVTPGTYYITVRAAGNGEAISGNSSYGSRGEYTVSVKVPTSDLTGPTAFLPTFVPVIKNRQVVFDASGSTDDKPGLLYRWDLGNGTIQDYGSSATISTTYPKTGSYTATVMVRDSDRLVSTAKTTVTVIEQSVSPVPALITAAAGSSWDARIFSAMPQGRRVAASYEWDWGDGTRTSTTERNVEHRFGAPGTYTVTVRITDVSNRLHIGTQTVEIQPASNLAPAASFTRGDAMATYPIAFDAGASTDDKGIVSYEWNWGNGTSSVTTGPVASHTYAIPGKYHVTLTVTDEEGLESTFMRPVIAASRLSFEIGETTVKVILPSSGAPVANISVKAAWIGTPNVVMTAITGPDGIAEFRGSLSRCPRLVLLGASAAVSLNSPATASAATLQLARAGTIQPANATVAPANWGQTRGCSGDFVQ